MKIRRREFLIRGGSAAVSLPLVALGSGETRAARPIPILDIHQHPDFDKRSVELLLVHQRYHKVTTTVLLPGDGWMHRRMSGNDEAWSHVRKHPDEIVTFCNVDPEREDAVKVLQKHLDKGALGIGEQKFELDANSPQMRRVYDVARDYGVPVLLHFGSKHNHGFERAQPRIRAFHKILEAYPQVGFLGHAGTWWSNISRDGKREGKVQKGGLSDKLLADYPNMYGDLSAGSGLNALKPGQEFRSRLRASPLPQADLGKRLLLPRRQGGDLSSGLLHRSALIGPAAGVCPGSGHPETDHLRQRCPSFEAGQASAAAHEIEQSLRPSGRHRESPA